MKAIKKKYIYKNNCLCNLLLEQTKIAKFPFFPCKMYKEYYQKLNKNSAWKKYPLLYLPYIKILNFQQFCLIINEAMQQFNFWLAINTCLITLGNSKVAVFPLA